MRHIGSKWRGFVKAAAFNMLPYWNIHPGAAQSANMDADAILQFTVDAVAALLLKDAFCDHGFDEYVSVFVFFLSYLSNNNVCSLAQSSSLHPSGISTPCRVVFL